MSKYRLCYRKFGPARYASHLDLGRALGRALRRAGLPVAYTQGFHPLPKMAFGPPLPVGVESEAEYVDITFTEPLAEDEIIGRLNRSLPPGLQVTGAVRLSPKAPALTVALDRLSYSFLVEVAEGWQERKIGDFLRALWEREELPVTRRRPDGEKTVDLRPFWDGYKFSFIEQGLLCLEITVVFGPRGTMRPDEFSSFFPSGWRVKKVTRTRAWSAKTNGNPVHRG